MAKNLRPRVSKSTTNARNEQKGPQWPSFPSLVSLSVVRNSQLLIFKDSHSSGRLHGPDQGKLVFPWSRLGSILKLGLLLGNQHFVAGTSGFMRRVVVTWSKLMLFGRPTGPDNNQPCCCKAKRLEVLLPRLTTENPSGGSV